MIIPATLSNPSIPVRETHQYVAVEFLPDDPGFSGTSKLGVLGVLGVLGSSEVRLLPREQGALGLDAEMGMEAFLGRGSQDISG